MTNILSEQASESYVTDDENRDLRFNKPEYFLVLNMERMCISAKAFPPHMAKYLEDHPEGVIVYPAEFVDCLKCRKDRIAIFRRRSTFFHRDAHDYARDNDDYWCNTCQGTGWGLAPREDIIKKYSVVTWEMKAANLSNSELIAEMDKSNHKTLYPQSVLKAEAAKRMTGAVDP